MVINASGSRCGPPLPAFLGPPPSASNNGEPTTNFQVCLIRDLPAGGSSAAVGGTAGNSSTSIDLSVNLAHHSRLLFFSVEVHQGAQGTGERQKTLWAVGV